MRRSLGFKSLRHWLGLAAGRERSPAPDSDAAATAINPYAASWDQYVKDIKPEAGKWPGDEWAHEAFWQLTFKQMFVEQGAKDWRRCVEIGAGSGKFTRYLLDCIKPYYALQSRPNNKFEWMSPDLIRSVLERIGFTVQFIPELSDRDAYFVASLSDLSHANALGPALFG